MPDAAPELFDFPFQTFNRLVALGILFQFCRFQTGDFIGDGVAIVGKKATVAAFDQIELIADDLGCRRRIEFGGTQITGAQIGLCLGVARQFVGQGFDAVMMNGEQRQQQQHIRKLAPDQGEKCAADEQPNALLAGEVGNGLDIDAEMKRVGIERQEIARDDGR